MGSFAPRVRYFLTAVAPDLEQDNVQAKLVSTGAPVTPLIQPLAGPPSEAIADYPSAPWSPPAVEHPSSEWRPAEKNNAQLVSNNGANGGRVEAQTVSWGGASRTGWYEPLKTSLAVLGAAVIALRLVKLVR